MTTYTKDNGRYSQPINFTNQFGTVDEKTIRLINVYARPIHKDAKGEYTYKAVKFDNAGNVSFEKEYRN